MSSTDYGATNYDGVGVANRTRTLFGQVMWYVAATAGLFALGSYLGRDLGSGWAFVFFILAFVCLIGMRFAVRSSAGLTVGLLFGMGLLLGLAMSPTLVYYASADPQALWQAGGATALFIAGCGAVGYATRTDLSGLARVCFWALLALIGFGVVLIFVRIPGGLYSVFVVHLNIQGSGRFTPFGDPAGTANNFTASADGTASPTTTVNGCLTNQEAVVIIWHSDHQAHGASAGTIGVDWHNALITRVT